MRGYWNHIPLIRYLIPLLAGITIAINLHFQETYWFYLSGSISLLFIVLQIIRKTSAAYRLQIFYGVLVNMILITGGICLVIVKTPLYQSSYFMHNVNDSTLFKCRIVQPPDNTAKNIKLYVAVEGKIEKMNYIPSKGRSIIYIKPDSNINFKYGDILYVPNKFTEPSSPKNPEAFDYKNYLNHLGIYHIAFLKSEEVYTTNESRPIWQWQMLFNCRTYFIRLMNNYVRDENSRSVVEALILGTKSDIDAEVQQAYANTGTMHILAVSGLHVGILFVILEFLFRPLKIFQHKKSRAVLYKTLFILFIIWIYACLTGMSPSVMRSAVMFSFLAIGRLFSRHIDSFNILFASMLPLIMLNPFQITQVGFQLSYLAVAGIIFFQPLIAKLWKPGSAFIKYIWSLTSVSIAAQLATVPVSIYYFHQFPNYFLLSNMLAIPISFVVLILGVAFFVLGWLPYLNGCLGFLLDHSLRLLNGSVLMIDRMPHAVANNLYLNLEETCTIYMAILFLGAFLKLKHKKYFIAMLIMIVIISFSISIRVMANNHMQEITFYNTKSTAAIAVKSGRSCYVFSNSDSLLLSDDYKYNFKGHFISQGIHHPQLINVSDSTARIEEDNLYFKWPFLMAGHFTFYFVNKSNQKELVAHADEIDYVILSSDPYLKIDSTLQFRKACFIIDNTNSWKSANYWKKAFNKNDLKFRNIKDESFTINF